MVKQDRRDKYWEDEASPTTPSYNDDDPGKLTHPMGFTVAQLSEEGRPPHQSWDKPAAPDGKSHDWWYDGNGGASEKLDTFWDMGHFSNSSG